MNVVCPECSHEAVVLEAGRAKLLERWRRDHEGKRTRIPVTPDPQTAEVEGA